MHGTHPTLGKCECEICTDTHSCRCGGTIRVERILDTCEDTGAQRDCCLMFECDNCGHEFRECREHKEEEIA